METDFVTLVWPILFVLMTVLNWKSQRECAKAIAIAREALNGWENSRLRMQETLKLIEKLKK